jgi:hypothetical protein
MEILEETATGKATRGFAKILAVIIILSVALFGDVMYIMEMQKVFSKDPMLLMFCYLGAIVGFMAIGYLLLGKSAVFAPGGQLLASWIVFGAELIIITLNIILVFNQHPTGFLAAWAYISPATPVAHLLGVSMIYFLDPEMKEKHRDMELQSKLRRADREYEHAVALARVKVKKQQLAYTVRELGNAINSDASQQRIAQHATNLNDTLLTEMSGRTLPKDDDSDSNDRYYGRR